MPLTILYLNTLSKPSPKSQYLVSFLSSAWTAVPEEFESNAIRIHKLLD